MAEQKSNSGISDWIPWLLTTVIGGALFVQSANKDQVANDPGNRILGSQNAQNDGGARADRFRRIEEPLYEHFGINPDEEPTHSQQPSGTDSQGKAGDKNQDQLRQHVEQKFQKCLEKCQLEFLIMTVADPVDSAENYRFDLQLDAVHKALSANPDDLWVFDGAYLPWQVFRDRFAKSNEIALVRKEHWYQDEPGLLVYRKIHRSEQVNKTKLDKAPEKAPSEHTDELLLVLLVGEMPTLGIQRDAFLVAVEEIDRLRRLKKGDSTTVTQKSESDGKSEGSDGSTNNTQKVAKPDNKSIAVIGPTFSGTAHSLVEAITTAIENQQSDQKIEKRGFEDFHVITGSATGIDRDRFDDHKIPFAATVCHSDDEQEAVLRHLNKDRWRKPNRKLAWLVESGSASGAKFARFAREPREAGEAKSVSDIQQVVYPYPMQISRVRKGFEQRMSSTKSRSKGDFEQLRSASSLPFDVLESARDLPTPQTPQMTAPSVELVLGQILDAIRRDGCDYVGIKATDIRDAVFLANMVKLHCPMSQLIIMQSDLLHTHPDFSDVMSGAIVVSSYPLFPEGLDWTVRSDTGKNSRVLLSNHSYYGIYNAVLLQRAVMNGERSLWSSNDMTLSVKSEHAHYLIGYRNPTPFGKSTDIDDELDRPGIWIQRIGASGFYPVKWDPVDKVDSAAKEVRPPKSPNYVIRVPLTKPPTTSLTLLDESAALWAGFLILLWIAILCSARTSRQWLEDFVDWLAPLGPSEKGSLVLSMHNFAWWLLVADALLLTATVLAGHGMFSPRRNAGLIAFTERNLFSGVSLLLPALLVFGAWFALAFGLLRRTYLVDRYAPEIDQFSKLLEKQSPESFSSGVANRLALNIRLLNRNVWKSKALVIGTLQLLIAAWVLFVHVWQTNANVSGSAALFWMVWIGLSITLLVWWISLIRLILLFENLKSELDQQRGQLHGGAYEIQDPPSSGWPGSMRPRQNSKDIIAAIGENAGVGIGRFLLDPGPSRNDKVARLTKQNQDGPFHDLLTSYRMIQIYFVHMRNHSLALGIAAFLLVLAVNSFPFPSMPWLRLITTGGLLTFALQVCWFYVKLERDEFLSFLLGTKPNAIEWNWPMIQRLGLLLSLAFATMLFQVFPESGSWLGGLLEPIVRLGK